MLCGDYFRSYTKRNESFIFIDSGADVCYLAKYIVNQFGQEFWMKIKPFWVKPPGWLESVNLDINWITGEVIVKDQKGLFLLLRNVNSPFGTVSPILFNIETFRRLLRRTKFKFF